MPRWTLSSEAAGQDGHLDTLISTLGQLVVELLTFVFKRDIRTDAQTHAKFNIDGVFILKFNMIYNR